MTLRLLTWLTLLVAAQQVFAQAAYIEPRFAGQDETVTLYFDAAAGTGGLAGCGCDVYVHTGLITAESTSASDWKYVPTEWGVADEAWRMTPVPGRPDLYSFELDIPAFYGFPAGTVVDSLALVFRDADGSREGKATGGGDIYVPIYAAGAATQAVLIRPGDGERVYTVGQTITVSAEASAPVTFALSVDGEEIDRVAGATRYDYELIAMDGAHSLTLAVGGGGLDTVLAFDYIVAADLTPAPVPAGTPYGLTREADGGAIVSLLAPARANAYLIGSFTEWQLVDSFQLTPTPDGSGFWGRVPAARLPAGEFAYQYVIDGGSPVADPFSALVLDPANDPYIEEETFAGIPSYPGQRGIATWVRPDVDYAWAYDDEPRGPEEELVIYELLVRDFVAAHDFATVLDSLDYLDRLGVTAIELMPVNEFEGNISWGYNPSFHGAIDKYYGPPESLKMLIDSAHGRGMRVIVDVVYNHAFGQNPYAQLYAAETAAAPDGAGPFFNAEAPHPYSVGVDFNHESPYTRTYVGQTLRYLFDEFHIDGVRFDLTKGFTQQPSTEATAANYDPSRIAIIEGYADTIRSVAPEAVIILEHFADNLEETELTADDLYVWGNMNYAYGQTAMGYANGSDLYGVTPQSRGWDDGLVGYQESHDEPRIRWKALEFGNGNAEYTTKDELESLRRLETNALFFYTVPGAKMLWQFGELGYAVDIDENGRTGPKPILWDLYQQAPNRRLYNVIRSLIALRKEYAVFTSGEGDLAAGLGGGLAKSLTLTDPELDVVMVGNFDIVPQSITASFPTPGTYYDYFSGDSVTVAGATEAFALLPGDYRLLTSRRLPAPPMGYIATTTSGLQPAPAGAEVRVWPNPSAADVNVEVRGWPASSLTCSVFAADGRLLLSRKRAAGTFTLPLAGLPAGAYTVLVTDERGRSVVRAVVRR